MVYGLQDAYCLNIWGGGGLLGQFKGETERTWRLIVMPAQLENIFLDNCCFLTNKDNVHVCKRSITIKDIKPLNQTIRHITRFACDKMYSEELLKKNITNQGCTIPHKQKTK